MDADLLRKARNLGGVTTDVSSRSYAYIPSEKKKGDNPGKPTTGWSRLFRHRKPE